MHSRRVSFTGSPCALVDRIAASFAGNADRAEIDLTVVVRHNTARRFGESWARKARRDKFAVLHLGVDADRVVLGPRWDSHHGGCLGCLHAWMREPWSAFLDPGEDVPHWDAAPPWSYPTQRIVEEMIAEAAHPAAKQFADGVIIYDLRTGAHGPHRFIQHPNCQVCRPSEDRAGGIAADLAQPRSVGSTFRERPLALRTGDLKAAFLDETTGFIRNVNQPSSPMLHPMTFAGFLRETEPARLEVGVGRTGIAAQDGPVAVLEAFERFVGFQARGDARRTIASYQELGALAIDPREFVLYEPEQVNEPSYHLSAFDPAAPYAWVPAYSWRRKRDVLIPEQIVYYDLNPNDENADRFVVETSNGCALGSSFSEASLFGLFEVLERDAYLTSWYGRLAPIRLDVSDYPDRYVQALVARMEGLGFEVHVFDIGVGLPIPTVGCVVIDPACDAPVKSRTAAGASLNPTQAISAALVEVCTNIIEMEPSAIEEIRQSAETMLADPGAVRTMADHTTLHAHPDSLERLAFMLDTPHCRNAREHFASRLGGASTFDLRTEFNTLAEAVLSTAHDLLIVDQGFATLDRLGVRGVKVLAPGLMPMSFGHQYRRISRNRLEAAVRARGRGETVPSTWLPHNFP